MNREELTKALLSVAGLYPGVTLTEQIFGAWFMNFRAHDIKPFMAALRAACNEPGRKFFPTAGEVQTYLKRDIPKSLTMTPSEALAERDSSNYLISDAREFADRVTPDISKTQFDSPEELARAERINQAIWEREFKQRFERRQAEAKLKVELGQDPKLAIASVLHGEIGAIAYQSATKSKSPELVDNRNELSLMVNGLAASKVMQ